MARRSLTPAAKAGQPHAAHPTEYVGRNDKGQVRPADPRYLEDDELDARDRYLLEKTGPDAQQLVAKRQGLETRLVRLDDEQLAVLMPEGFEGDRAALIAALTDAATAMPNAQYRALLEQFDQVLDDGAEA